MYQQPQKAKMYTSSWAWWRVWLCRYTPLLWQRVESCWFCFAICLIRSPSPGSGLHRYTSERGKLGQILCRRYFGFRVILPGTYRFLSSESRYGMHYRLIQGGKLIQGTSCKLNTGIFLDQNTSRNLLDKPRRLDPNYKHPYTIYSPTSSFSWYESKQSRKKRAHTKKLYLNIFSYFFHRSSKLRNLETLKLWNFETLSHLTRSSRQLIQRAQRKKKSNIIKNQWSKMARILRYVFISNS